MARVIFFLVSVFLIFTSSSAAQVDQPKYEITAEDKAALENIIVERYYTATDSDYKDTTGGALMKGAVTYRVYVDLKPDYLLLDVFGSTKHELRIETSTRFFNNTYSGALIGYNVTNKKLNDNTVALDSWVTINSATNHHAGILKSEDQDGSILTSRKELEKADGLTNGNLPMIKLFNLDLNFFDNNKDASSFTTSNGGWAAISGITSGSKGPTPSNRILIAQLTTDGKLSFELNILVKTPTGGGIQFVAKNPEGEEIKFDGLNYRPGEKEKKQATNN